MADRQQACAVTPAAIEAFKEMEKLRHRTSAAARDQWWEHHSALHDELGRRPWEWPAFEYPDAVNPYPAESPAAAHWELDREKRPEALELYRQLKEASK